MEPVRYEHPVTCAYCGRRQEIATRMNDAAPPGAPAAGSLLMCIDCGGLMELGAEGTTKRVRWKELPRETRTELMLVYALYHHGNGEN